MVFSPPKASIDAATRLYGIFGNPVDHSLSPLIHNALFQKLGMNSVYLAFRVEPPALGLAFEAVRTLGIRGVNITIPFKEMAVDLVDEIPEDLDRCVGAVNTVVNRSGKLYGFNTDGQGFLMALHEELSFNPAGKKILLLGAGGAARGVLFSLARARAEKIFIYNRTRERARGLNEYAATYFPETEITALDSLEPLGKESPDLVVNATSCGMKKKDPLPFDPALLKNKPAVYDLVYSPAETPFLKAARGLGLPNANGLGMLANQAALSFELWTGQKEGVRDAMLEMLKKCCL